MKKILLVKGENTVFNRKHFEESGFMVVVVTDRYGIEVLEICEFNFILIDNQLLTVLKNRLYDKIRDYCNTPILLCEIQRTS